MISLLAAVPPILTPYYRIVFWVTIIEMFLVIIFGALGVAFQWFLKRQRERSKMARTRIQKILVLASEKDTPFDLNTLAESKLNYLLPAVLAMNTLDSVGPRWNKIQETLQEKYLLPMARKLTYQHRWTKKLKAIRCFAMAPQVEDEKYVLHLLQQKIPIIKYAAAHVAGHLATPNTLNAILEEMNHATHYLRHPFHDALRRGGEGSYQYLKKRFETEKNPFTRVSMLEVLADKMDDVIVNLLEPDLQSEHKNLKISAIKALGHYQSAKSIQLLLKQLDSQEWEVRALAARSLGYLRAQEAVDQLSKLCGDKTWWVRMNAALALKRIGPSGLSRLRGLKSEEDRYAYEISQYVLSLQE
jgi:hypothetical protein